MKASFLWAFVVVLMLTTSLAVLWSNRSIVKNEVVGQSPQMKVDVNTADKATLEVLPRIGPAIAEAIVVYRNEHGPFESAEDLENVPRIGPKTRKLLENYVRFGSSESHAASN